MTDSTVIENADQLLETIEKTTGESYMDALKEGGFADVTIDDAKDLATKQYYDELTTGMGRRAKLPPYLQFYKKPVHPLQELKAHR